MGQIADQNLASLNGKMLERVMSGECALAILEYDLVHAIFANDFIQIDKTLCTGVSHAMIADINDVDYVGQVAIYELLDQLNGDHSVRTD